jgi:hypothetical protein
MTDHEDLWSQPTTVAWARRVLNDMAPKLRDSACSISLYPSDGSVGDVKYWVELGATIMMRKPLMVVVMGDAEIPPKLALIADQVVRLPDGVTPGASETLAKEVATFVAQLGPES